MYMELGFAGLTAVFFGYMIVNLIKSQTVQSKVLENLKVENAKQSETIENMESILLKLLTRIDRDGDMQKSERDRRHEDVLRELGDLTSSVSRIEGAISRINGK